MPWQPKAFARTSLLLVSSSLLIAFLGACASKPKPPPIPPKPVGTEGPVVPLRLEAGNTDFCSFAPPYVILSQGRRKLVHVFSMRVLEDVQPTHIHIEDLSDGVARVLLDEAGPRLDERHQWHGQSGEFSLGDPGTEWLSSPGVTLREYLFRVDFVDGRFLEQRVRGPEIPAYVKDGLRKQLTGR